MWIQFLHTNTQFSVECQHLWKGKTKTSIGEQMCKLFNVCKSYNEYTYLYAYEKEKRKC